MKAVFVAYDTVEDCCTCGRPLEGDPYRLTLGEQTFNLCDDCAPGVSSILRAAEVEVEYPEQAAYQPPSREPRGWKV